MTIKLLALSGSPAKGSSTDRILQRLAADVEKGLDGAALVEITFVKLNDRAILPCQACGEAPTPKWCFYGDINDLYKLLVECDCLLFGSPVYFDSVSAQAKLFIDRCNCFRPPDFDNVDPERSFIKLIKRKRAGAIVLVGGEEGWFEGARRCIAGYFKWVEVTNEGVISYRSQDFNEKGTALGDPEVIRQIKEAAKDVVEKLRSDIATRGQL